VEDVRAEIVAITRQLTMVCLVILVLIVGLSGYIIAQSARSERRRQVVDAALRESEEKYRLLAETAREFIIAFDAIGRIVYANRAWLAAGGFAPEQLREKSIFELLPENARAAFAQRLQAIGAGHSPAVMFEAELLAADGSAIPVEAGLAPLKDDEKTLRTFITARDVTEKKQAEKQAELHREQLFQADKMATLGTLVSGVAHEINNPVTFVMLNAPILQQAWSAVLPILDDHREAHGDFKVGRMDYSQLRARIPLLLANIVAGADRVKTIVGDLKDFARQGPSQMADTVDLNAVAAKAVALAGNLVQKSTQRFCAEYGRPMPTFTGNAQKIEQVIINLLVNACQSLPDSRRRVRLVTGSTKSPPCAFIVVDDEGCGMTEAVLQRIRDPFFTTKRESGGTGLGLAIADRIVKEHGGEMTFASAVDRGTTVRVVFPAQHPNHPQKEAPHD
jgi:PAS domain S-box-containing protein